MSELLPCPHCGSTPQLEDHRTAWLVHCACGASLLGERAPEPTEEMPDAYWVRFERSAVDGWNRRTPKEQPQAPSGLTELPPLPESGGMVKIMGSMAFVYTREQMRAYARAALAHRATAQAQPSGNSGELISDRAAADDPVAADVERARFEVWAVKQEIPDSGGLTLYPLNRTRRNGDYDWPVTSHAWNGWRAALTTQAPAEPAQACGHPASLLLKSAETGEPLYCELCDDKSGRRDAEAMEAELRAKLSEAEETIRNLTNALREESEPQTFMGEPVRGYVESRNGCAACKARLAEILAAPTPVEPGNPAGQAETWEFTSETLMRKVGSEWPDFMAPQRLFKAGDRVHPAGAQGGEPAAADEGPEFTDSARNALLWLLWHHQGGSSDVGQPIRFALGMGQHERMTADQVKRAKRWAASAGDQAKGEGQ